MKTKISLYALLFVAITVLIGCSGNERIEYFPFSDEDKERWGIVDAEGNIVVEKEWKQRPALPFNNFTKVKNKRGLWEFFTISEKPEQVGDEYISAGNFSEGLAPVCEPDKTISYINKKGRMEFDLDKNIVAAGIFRDGLALIVTNKNKYGFINKKGEVVIEAIFDFASIFKDGLARVVQIENGVEQTSFINHGGQKVFTLSENIICNSDFSEGLVVVKENGEYGYLNKKGVYAIPPVKHRSYAGDFIDNFAVVGDGDDYGIINKSGKEVVRTKYDGYLKLMYNQMATIEEDLEFGFINAEGDELISPEYDEILPFFNEITIVKNRDYEFIDNEGNQVGETELEFVPINKIINEFLVLEHELVESDYLDVSLVAESIFNNFNLKNDNIKILGLNKLTNIRTIVEKYTISEDDIEAKSEVLNLIKDSLLTKEITYSADLYFNEDYKKGLRPKKVSDSTGVSYYKTIGTELDTTVAPSKFEFKVSCSGKSKEKINMVIRAFDKEIRKLDYVSEIDLNEINFVADSLSKIMYSYKNEKALTIEVDKDRNIIITAHLF